MDSHAEKRRHHRYYQLTFADVAQASVAVAASRRCAARPGKATWHDPAPASDEPKALSSPHMVNILRFAISFFSSAVGNLGV